MYFHLKKSKIDFLPSVNPPTPPPPQKKKKTILDFQMYKSNQQILVLKFLGSIMDPQHTNQGQL